jgi:ankyrin repeat protein
MSLRRIAFRVVLFAGLLVGIALIIATKSWRSVSAPIALPNPKELDKALLAAVRDGGHATVQALLDQGADVKARNEVGDTVLMQAVLNADREMMQLLLQRGADVHERGVYDVTVLLRAVHDPYKVRLLLSHGARIDERAMVLAAMAPGSRKTLELLFSRGGSVNANVGGYTVLMAAAYSGDLDAVTWLVERGADVKARSEAGCTALNGAAVSGNAAIVKLLLDRGADPNVRYQEPDTIGDFQTPLMNASWHGHVECLKLLLEHGADVTVQGGPFDRSPLLCAATTGSEEAVRLLLARGANVHAQDWKGDTALDWARLRGDTSIVQLLGKASNKSRSEVAVRETESLKRERPRLHQRIDGNSVRKAVATSLPLLQRSGQKITQTKKCITCHQHSLVAMTVGLARKHGFAVDEEVAAEERGHVQAFLGRRVPLLLLGAELDPTLAAYSLMGFAAEDQQPNPLTDALVHYLVLHQHQDGRWPTEAYRPPEDGSAFLFTALAVRGLHAYAPRGRSAEIADRIARARRWLLAARPRETVDSAFQILGLKWAHAAAEGIEKAAGLLLHQQREDGGWAQLPTLPSDAYATGQVLFALHEAGGLPVDALAYRRGIEFLLRTQLVDGSWYVPTRCFPALAFSSSGFPHGRSQFISAAATCWATMVLMLSRENERTMLSNSLDSAERRAAASAVRGGYLSRQRSWWAEAQQDQFRCPSASSTQRPHRHRRGKPIATSESGARSAPDASGAIS